MGDCCAEPTLDEILDDQAIRLLMERDHVQEGAVRELLGHVMLNRAADRGDQPQPRASRSFVVRA